MASTPSLPTDTSGDFASSFCRRIAILRAAFRLTQSDFGKATGLSQNSVSRLERGEAKALTLDHIGALVAFANGRGVRTEWLVSGLGPMEVPKERT